MSVTDNLDIQPSLAAIKIRKNMLDLEGTKLCKWLEGSEYDPLVYLRHKSVN